MPQKRQILRTPQLSHSSQKQSLWRNCNFLLLWSGQLISAIGSQVSFFAFPWLILTLTNSPALAGWMSATRILPYLLFGLPAGALVDRWNRKRIMLVCDAGRALALGSIPFALLLGKLAVLQLFLASFIEGTLFIFFGAAETACLPHIVSEEQLPTATAQNEFVYAAAGLLGPSLSGFLSTAGQALPFLADACSYVVSVISLLFIRIPKQEASSAPRRGLWADIKEGIHWLWQHPVIRFLALLVAGLNSASAGYLLILLVWARTFHTSNVLTGLVGACSGIGWVIGASLAGLLARRFSFRILLIGATWLWALSWLLFAIPTSIWMLGGAALLAFLVVPLHTSTHYTYRLTHIPDQLQGRVNTLIRLLLFGGQALGLLLTGLLLQTCGPVGTVLLLFIPQFALAILTTLYARAWKEQQQ
jgi:MFS family permease